MQFVGENRTARVEDVLATFEGVTWSRTPRLICLESLPGWGKTRLVQEVYAKLAESQRYWPRSLERTPAHGQADHALTGLVDPGAFFVERGIHPPWLWSGIASEPELAQHVVESLRLRLDAHLRILTATAERNRGMTVATGSVVGVAVGSLFTEVGTAISGAGALLSIVRAFDRGRNVAYAKQPQMVLTASGSGSSVDRLIADLRRAEVAGLPVITVIDDAHDADESLAAFLEQVFAGPMPVAMMCVCCARSDRLAADEQRDGSFGNWLAGAATRFRDRVSRVPLSRLLDSDIARIVEQLAPRTPVEVRTALAGRADGNPLALVGLMTTERLRDSIRDDAITLQVQEVATLPGTYGEALRQHWEGLQVDVQRFLYVSAAQGRAFLPTLGSKAFGILFPERADTYDRIETIVERSGWIAHVGDVCYFREEYGYEIAKSALLRALKQEQLDELYVSIAEAVAGEKSRASWSARSERTRAMLLALHVRVASLCTRGQTRRVDQASIAASAEELGLLRLEHGEPRAALRMFERAAENAAVLGLDHPAALLARGNLAVAVHATRSGEGALSQLREVLSEHERVLGRGHPDTLTATANLAVVLYDAYRYEEAIGLQRWVLESSEQLLGPDHADAITARVNLATTLGDSGRHEEAIALRRRIVEDAQRIRGNDHLDTWVARCGLAYVLLAHGDGSESRELYTLATAFFARVLGDRHDYVLAARDELGRAYDAEGNVDRAVPLHERTLADREQILGLDHPDTLLSRHNLAVAYRKAGDIEKALPLSKRALADCERVLGPEDPDTLTSRDNLARAYEAEGNLDRAVPLLERTLADREQILGSDHPDTLQSRNNLAVVYVQIGDVDGGVVLSERALSDSERVFGPDHPDTLASRNNLASAYRAQGDFARALPVFERTLSDSERILGLEHASTLTIANNLAEAFFAAGDLVQSTSLFQRTLADRERVLGPDHSDTLATRNNLAAAYRAAADFDHAIPLFERTVAGWERVRGTHHPDTLDSRAQLAHAYWASGDLDRSIPLFERTLDERERVLGLDHPDTLRTRNNLAVNYRGAGDLDRAILLFERTLADRQRVLGLDHPDTVTSRNDLASSLDEGRDSRSDGH